MTIGQRIAQKRKELGLSQEALGDQLGVSRQSIYKWESDAALPEIEKLIALSRLFGVSVGWVLGVEDPPPETAEVPPEAELTEQQLKGVEEEPGPAAPEPGELTEQQRMLVEEIVARYLAAQPAPRKRRRWPWVLAVLALAAGALALFQRLDRMDQQVQALQSSVSQVTSDVGYQISSISGKVEDLLKAQNNLTADYGAELKHLSLREGEPGLAVFSAYAVPKNFQAGMTAEFQIDNGTGGVQAVPGVLRSDGQTFFADSIACRLTDEISLSVVFITPDGTRQTQLLDQFEGLYSDTVPSLDVQDEFWNLALRGGTLVLGENGHERYLYTREETWASREDLTAAVAEVRVGLFKNQELAAWAEPCEVPENYHGFDDEFTFYQLPVLELPLGPEDVVQAAAVVTDEFGRISIAPGSPLIPDESDGTLTYPSQYRMDRDPAHWRF